MVRGGDVIRVTRGLYQSLDTRHSLVEASKRGPKGVVCLMSALTYHELSDQLPRAIRMTISTRDRTPKKEGGRCGSCGSRMRCSLAMS